VVQNATWERACEFGGVEETVVAVAPEGVRHAMKRWNLCLSFPDCGEFLSDEPEINMY